MRKKVDERIRVIIENGVKLRHRSMFVIVGDKSRDQIVNLHHILSKAVVKSRPSVLWCYKDKLELSSHRKKRAKQIQKQLQRGLLDPDNVDAFELFVETGVLTYCMYKDSEKILGNTFGMCILQDFEALTPNLLARTIETVEGGGLIVLLLRSLPSLTSLYTMVMDVHERFCTESHSKVAGRFNERFLLSLASCKACVAMDDELNILPISSHIRLITQVPEQEDSDRLPQALWDLNYLKEELQDDLPVGPLIKKCCTLDQGKALIACLDAILDKTLCGTVALLASRGRGKSAALGLAVAGAVAAKYSNIFVTAPSPENLKTLFEFICKGLDALEFKEQNDYDVVWSVNPGLKKAIVRININKDHRQTIQYIQPHEHERLSQAELLVIDEAAAIPLPVVKSLLGTYLVFLSSTVNGYEGTGRSLSLKLLQQLEELRQMSGKHLEAALPGRFYKKMELSESIRYASGDPIESWLSALLCLDVTNAIPAIRRLPPPSDCDLYYVNRDTLFSYHKDSELFLQRMMALYVSSHYKNSPNDLQLMADAPAHHLFVLLGPVDESKNQLPDILCVIQVCLEGQISRQSAIKSLRDGHQPFGDQIPWKFCEQFRDIVFPSLSSARIVRIATHPSAVRLGYGSAAVELLARYYEGQLAPISEEDFDNDDKTAHIRFTEAAEKVSLLEENIKPRTDLPHLLVHLRERRPEKLHYLGVSFGLTLELFRFWRKQKFAPFYIGNVPSAVTGERTCMVLRPLNSDEFEVHESAKWGFFGPFYQEFKKKFTRQLTYCFRTMEHKLAMSVLDPKINFTNTKLEPPSSTSEGLWTPLSGDISTFDMKMVKDFADNLLDNRAIIELVPVLARIYFQGKLPVTLSYSQASLLLCMGLQLQDITNIEEQMKPERPWTLFKKIMKKFRKYFDGIASNEILSSLPQIKERLLEPHSFSVDEDLDEAAKQVEAKMKTETERIPNPDLFQRYAILDKNSDFENALQDRGRMTAGGVVSVKSNRIKVEKHGKQEGHERGKKRRDHIYKSNKKGFLLRPCKGGELGN